MASAKFKVPPPPPVQEVIIECTIEEAKMVHALLGQVTGNSHVDIYELWSAIGKLLPAGPALKVTTRNHATHDIEVGQLLTVDNLTVGKKG